MWPFKRKQQISVPKEPSPCGDDEVHYFWEIEQGLVCPVCLGKERLANERKMQIEQANLIADAIVKRLRGK